MGSWGSSLVPHFGSCDDPPLWVVDEIRTREEPLVLRRPPLRPPRSDLTILYTIYYYTLRFKSIWIFGYFLQDVI